MGKIAPHQNREVMLVLNGYKPLAVVEKSKDLAGYCLAIQLGGAGLLAYQVGPSEDCCDGEVVFTKPGNRHHIQAFDYLNRHGVEDLGLKEYHRKMGQLFGYGEDDIEAFINDNINCECTKCRGSH